MKSRHSTPVLLFDGLCNLCSSSVQFVLKHDKKARFHFASLQSEVGQELLKAHGLATDDFDSFVLIKGGKIFTQSSAALQVAGQLNFPLNLLKLLLIIPRPIRDFCYNFMAKNRYKWFGKKASCWLPKPEWKGRFLDSE